MPTPKKDLSTPEGRRAASFGRWFRSRRSRIKRTLKMCAQVSGYSVSMLSEIERGLYDPLKLSLKAIPALSRAYNVRPEAILWRLGIIEAPAISGWEEVKRSMEEE